MTEHVSLDELQEARDAGQKVVDVRNHDEYSAGHVPGAHLMPLADLPRRTGELPRDRPVFIVCQKGGRSTEAAALLRAAGVDARPVDGGTDGWARTGRPLEFGEAPGRKGHA